jgi:RND family efflux transporter MFP subunit
MISSEQFKNHLEGTGKVMKKIMALGTVFAFTAVLSGCSLLPREQNVQAPVLVTPAKIDYNFAEVKRGTLVKNIGGVGTFVSVNQQNAYLAYGKGGNLTAIYAKPGDSVKAGQVLAEVDSGDLKNQVEEQKLVVKRAEIELEKCKASKGSSFDIQESDISLQLAKLQLQNLLEELDKTKIIAKIPGRIVYSSYSKLGDYIDAYKTLFAVADTRDLQIEYSGSNVDEFKLGMKVNVTYKSTSYQGEVVVIPSSDPNSGNSKELKKIKIALKEIPKGAQIGENADINVELLRKENVLIVPNDSVHEYQGHYYVEMLENNIKVEKYVSVGVQSDTETEIKHGLKEGDKIITQ